MGCCVALIAGPKQRSRPKADDEQSWRTELPKYLGFWVLDGTGYYWAGDKVACALPEVPTLTGMNKCMVGFAVFTRRSSSPGRLAA